MGECLIIRGGGGTDTSNANATAGKVLTGYSCYVNDVKISGSMTNRGAATSTLNPGGSYTIQAGYHNGSGKISVNSLSSQTSATANAGRILSGRTAWVGGSKLTGTMTNRGAVSKALGANGSYTIPAGWHNGSGKVTQNLTKQAAVNVTPGTANKTACAANRWTTGNIVIVGSSNLKAANIKNGVTIFGVKGTFTGWVDGSIYIFQNGKIQSGFSWKWIAYTSGRSPSYNSSGWLTLSDVSVYVKIPGISSGSKPSSASMIQVVCRGTGSKVSIYCAAYSSWFDDAVNGFRNDQPFGQASNAWNVLWWFDPTGSTGTSASNVTISYTSLREGGTLVWGNVDTWNGWIGVYGGASFNLVSIIYKP